MPIFYITICINLQFIHAMDECSNLVRNNCTYKACDCASLLVDTFTARF